jgi:predicted regulator of Ras-like GTPase activity (Roadblock/LC7/MglB family)
VTTLRPPPSLAARDQADTDFSRHLDALLRQVPEALCAVFVDAEGEAIDLASRIDPFDARVAGAEVAIVLAGARMAAARLGQGTALEIRIEGTLRSVIVRNVSSAGYDLVLLVASPSISAHAAEMAAATALALLIEAGLEPPASYAVLRSVEQKPSRTGMVVPSAFDDHGVRRRVEAVIGHRCEDGEVKFLVRLADGEELVMVQERASGRWTRG